MNRIICLCIYLLFVYDGFCLTWPTGNINVVQTYGAYEFTQASSSYSNFHRGIDIDAPAGADVKSVGDGRIIDVNQDPSGSIQVVIQLSNGDIAVYSHVVQNIAQTNIQLYSINSNNILISNIPPPTPIDPIGGIPISVNTVFAVIDNINSANVTHPHLHFEYAKAIGGIVKIINPLDVLTPSDPANLDPNIGSLFFKNYTSGIYETSTVFNKIEVINEITDNQGSIIYNPNNSSPLHTIHDGTSYGTPSERVDAKISGPYSFEFSIHNKIGAEVYPNSMNKKCKLIMANPDPGNQPRFPIPNFSLLYALDKPSYQYSLPYSLGNSHCYRLTNIEPTIISSTNPIGQISSTTRYWNS